MPSTVLTLRNGGQSDLQRQAAHSLLKRLLPGKPLALVLLGQFWKVCPNPCKRQFQQSVLLSPNPIPMLLVLVAPGLDTGRIRSIGLSLRASGYGAKYASSARGAALSLVLSPPFSAVGSWIASSKHPTRHG